MISYDRWQKTARGTNVQSAKRKSKAMEEVEGVFFRLMSALNFLIHKYKSRKKQAVVITRESVKDTRIVTQQH
jgi:hypothetical protein